MCLTERGKRVFSQCLKPQGQIDKLGHKKEAFTESKFGTSMPRSSDHSLSRTSAQNLGMEGCHRIHLNHSCDHPISGLFGKGYGCVTQFIELVHHDFLSWKILAVCLTVVTGYVFRALWVRDLCNDRWLGFSRCGK